MAAAQNSDRQVISLAVKVVGRLLIIEADELGGNVVEGNDDKLPKLVLFLVHQLFCFGAIFYEF